MYYFILPDCGRPVGGVKVILNFVNLLHRAGYRVAPLYGSATHTYPYTSCDVPAFYHTALSYIPQQWISWRQKAIATLKSLPQNWGAGAVNIPLQKMPGDVFVIPEYAYPEFSELFLDHPRILLAQDVFGFSRAFVRDAKRKAMVCNTFDAVITTSNASQQAVATIGGLESYNIPLHVATAESGFCQDKKLQIAYMPRKRPEDMDIVLTALQQRPALAGIPVVKIQSMTDAEVARIMRESLIFLSFSSQEGFGLPPAEAMHAGCITIGYTGVGGDEFFTPRTGFPIADSDVVNFVKTVEQVVTRYQNDPNSLDELRRRASQHIGTTYNFDTMHHALLESWQEIDARLRQP